MSEITGIRLGIGIENKYVYNYRLRCRQFVMLKIMSKKKNQTKFVSRLVHEGYIDNARNA